MYDWNKKHMLEPEPPPPTRLERISIYINKNFKRRFSEGEQFLIVSVVLVVLVIAVIALQAFFGDINMGEALFFGLISLFFLMLGLAYILFPEKMWKLRHLLSVKNGEPTDFAIFGSILSGILLVVVGIAIILFYPLISY